MDSFDSRALRYTDCYGQRFMRPGTYHYRLGVPGSRGFTDDRPYAVTIGERNGDQRMAQYNVTVRRQDGDLVAEPAEISIGLGDMVVWNCPDARTFSFAIDGDKDFFGNENLMNEAGYSHAFGTPGEYVWVDANGSGLRGVVKVRPPDVGSKEEREAWGAELRKGTLVLITADRAEPAEVEILTGQTVMFAVVKTNGVTITDARLRERKEASS